MRFLQIARNAQNLEIVSVVAAALRDRHDVINVIFLTKYLKTNRAFPFLRFL